MNLDSSISNQKYVDNLIECKEHSKKLLSITTDYLRSVFPDFGHDKQLEYLHAHYSEKQLLQAVRQARNHEKTLIAVNLVFADLVSSRFDETKTLMSITEHLRIVPPTTKDKTLRVGWHKDTWFGYDRRTMNFWIPVTDVVDNGLVFYSGPESRLKLTKDESWTNCLSRRVSLEESSICRLNFQFGKGLLFPGAWLHGASELASEVTRVSWDHRVMPEVAAKLNPRLNEFVYVDLLKKYPEDLPRAQQETYERLDRKSLWRPFSLVLFYQGAGVNIITSKLHTIVSRLKTVKRIALGG